MANSIPTTIFNAKIFIGSEIIPVISFNYEYQREMELVHVNQAEPVGKTKGKRTYSGQMQVLLYDALRLEAAAPSRNGSWAIDELNFDIVHTQEFDALNYNSKTLKNCSISSLNVEAAEGDMNMKVTLPFIFTGIITA